MLPLDREFLLESLKAVISIHLRKAGRDVRLNDRLPFAMDPLNLL